MLTKNESLLLAIKVKLSEVADHDSEQVVALSGGAASVLLVYLLKQFEYPVRCVHVKQEAGSEFAADWELFCREFCTEYEVPLQVIEAPALDGIFPSPALRAVAQRKQRYALLCNEVTSANSALFTAQPKEDQVETIFYRLMTGTSPTEAIAVREQVLRTEGVVPVVHVRPFINMLSKEDVLDLAQELDLPYVVDLNQLESESIAANPIRHKVFPVLREVLPDFEAQLLKVGAGSEEASALLTDLAHQDMRELNAHADQLTLRVPNALAGRRLKNMIQVWSQAVDVPISTRRIEEVCHGAVVLRDMKATPSRMIRALSGCTCHGKRATLVSVISASEVALSVRVA